MPEKRGKTVSVGICAHNEEQTIGKLIDQVLDEDIPVKQVIVAVAGEDRTGEIVKEKMDEYDEVVLIEEDEREGQSVAQNKIFERVDEDLFFFLDADGLIKEGSMEKMYSEYDCSAILHSREVPMDEDGVMGSIVKELWNIHHHFCLENPKFSAQMGLIPADQAYRIPEDVVLDDEYVAVRAMEDGYDVQYVPEAIKYHNTSLKFPVYFAQRKKNWAGSWQLEEKGYEYSVDNSDKLRIFARYFLKSSSWSKLILVLMAVIESSAIAMAYLDKIRSDYPTVWRREKLDPDREGL